MGIIIYTLYIHHKAEGHQVRILCTQVSYSFHIPGFVLSSYWLLLWAPRDYQPKFRCMHLFSCLRKLRLEIRGTMPEHSARISLHQYISNWLNSVFKKAAIICKRWMARNEWRTRYSLKTQWQLGHPGGWAGQGMNLLASTSDAQRVMIMCLWSWCQLRVDLWQDLSVKHICWNILASLHLWVLKACKIFYMVLAKGEQHK